MPAFSQQQARQDVLSMIDHVLKTVDPYQISQQTMQLKNGKVIFRQFAANIDFKNGRLFVISVGKAAIPMCQAVLDLLDDNIYVGIGISKQPVSTWPATHPKIKFYQGNHPIPGPDSIAATTAVLDLLSQTQEDDSVLCLISGGTSALLTQPLISLDDWQALNQALLASGCTIKEFNTVRRQLDAVKGGGLAAFASPAAVYSLILSDVIGDELAAIGSGPTVFVSESPQTALDILKRLHIESVLDTAVAQRIISTLQSAPPKQVHSPTNNMIIGSLTTAAAAAQKQAETLGFHSNIVTSHLEGEAREAGKFVAALAKDLLPGTCLILGGETTVTLKGNGRGGRNLELALAAAIALADSHCVNTAIATFATDGDDGQTGTAGAIITKETVKHGREHDLNAQQYLDNNDSYTYFKTLDDASYGPHLIISGQTGNNVNDLIFIMHYR